MPPKTLVLTGAPLSSALTFLDSDLSAPLLPAFSSSSALHTENLQPSSKITTWRSLSLHPQHLSTGFTPATVSFHDYAPAELNDQDLSSESQDLSTSSYYTINSFASAHTCPSPSLPDPNSIIPATHLSDIPSATHIQSLAPQTLSVHLVVGIISIFPPQTIHPHNNPSKPLELLEIAVGDDTSSPFTIKIWLPKVSGVGTGELRTEVSRVRRRDVVLFRNVALGAWMGQVYGYSLRFTGCEILWTSMMKDRRKGKREERGKVERVREWVIGFLPVAEGEGGGEGDRGGKGLPEDTQ